MTGVKGLRRLIPWAFWWGRGRGCRCEAEDSGFARAFAFRSPPMSRPRGRRAAGAFPTSPVPTFHEPKKRHELYLFP